MMVKTAVKTVAFHTLGCKVNRYETDAIAKLFTDAGYQVRDFDDTAEVYVINTCTVTGEADRKSRQMVRQAKKRNPDAIIVAMGCHVELSDISSNEDSLVSVADILIGNKDKTRALELVEAKFAEMYADRKDTVADALFSHSFVPVDPSLEFEEMGMVTSQEETRAYIKIEDGCNNFCSYCAIPYARGRVRSRREDAILAEAEGLVKNGFKEIVLTGIHVCSYGAEWGLGSEALPDLTMKLSRIPGLERIRFGSLEPQSLTPEFIRKASLIPNLCPHFHLSMQSGSDSVLKRMNRHYDTAKYADVVNRLREAIPSAMITTDVITGFPGETEEEHKETLEFCRKMNFLSMHVFKFSERKGTRAAQMKPKVSGETANIRSRELIELARSMKEEYFRNAVGQTFRVLVETVSDSFATGYTENYIPAKIILSDQGRPVIQAETVAPGRILTVKAVRYDQDGIYTEFTV